MMKKSLVLAVFGMPALLLAGACEKSSPANLVSPTASVASMSGSFAQNPIPFNGRATCPANFPNSWVIQPTLTESQGVEVNLKSWSYVIKNRSGSVVDSEELAEATIASAFGSSRLPAKGSLSRALLDCQPASFTGGSVEFTFFGVDANGFPVKASMSATLAQ